MVAAYIRNLDACISKTSRLCTMLEKLMVNDYAESALPKIIRLMEECDTRFQSNESWAKRFGCSAAKTPKRRRNGANEDA